MTKIYLLNNTLSTEIKESFHFIMDQIHSNNKKYPLFIIQKYNFSSYLWRFRTNKMYFEKCDREIRKNIH